jgi:chemotaxis protein MotB
MNDEARAPIIIKRVKKVSGGHHGGAWKIAYADFVTAMMAFFLLMWLIGSTAAGDLKGIADFFQTPLRVALAGGKGSGDASSIIQGGGEDLSRTAGQVRRSDEPAKRQTINLQAARAEMRRREQEKLENLRARFEQAMQNNDKLAQFKNQIRLEITAEGLQVTVVDEQNRAMFDTGGAALKDYTRDIMRAIGGLLNDVDNAISIAGHTDAAQYALGERGYSNWELSADRANASRRELVAGGMKDNKVLRVVGLASSLPLDTENPLNPMNRRISLVVLNDKTERQIRGLPEEPVEEIQNEADAAQVLGLGDDAPAEGEAAPAEVPSLAPPGEAPGAPRATPEQRVALPAGRDPA